MKECATDDFRGSNRELDSRVGRQAGNPQRVLMINNTDPRGQVAWLNVGRRRDKHVSGQAGSKQAEQTLKLVTTVQIGE